MFFCVSLLRFCQVKLAISGLYSHTHVCQQLAIKIMPADLWSLHAAGRQNAHGSLHSQHSSSCELASRCHVSPILTPHAELVNSWSQLA